jgi:CheY-like chemotaxis protein
LPDVRATLSGLLSDEGYEVRSASSRVEALQLVDAGRFHVAVLDVRLDETDEDNQDGLLLMHEIREKDPSIAIIILTGYASIKMVRDVLQPDRDGVSPAFGFLEKSTIADLIAQGENDRVEFKSSMRWDFEQNKVNKVLQEVIAKTITGMLNSEGGFLLIGVADDGTVLGIEDDLKTLHKNRNIDGFQLVLTDIVRTYLGIECMTHIRMRFELVNSKHVCIVSVKRSPSPVFLAKGKASEFWVRMGSSTCSLDVKAATRYMQEKWGKVG